MSSDYSADLQGVLERSVDTVKLGAKGPRLQAWAARHGIALPAAIYDILPVGADGVLARVGSGELILECTADEPLLGQMEVALAAADGDVYRIEQQSVSLVLKGDAALAVLAQTCGMDWAREPTGRIAYTRVAGASCAVLPLADGDQRSYRLWVDHSLVPYLWETLAQIAAAVRVT